MNNQTIPVYIPEPLYHRLEQFARISRHSVEDVIVQSLNATLPSVSDDVPDDLYNDFMALEQLTDNDLWHVANSVATMDQQEQLRTLQEKKKLTNLTESEEERLTQLHYQANELMVRKAYAFVLLKWRGHTLPTLDELESHQ